MKVDVIIPAAGMGKRIGGSTKKQFLVLGDKPIIIYPLEVFESIPEIKSIQLVLQTGDIEFGQKALESFPFTKVNIVSGGKERQDSVYNGIRHITSPSDIILIHDGVRPFISTELINNIITASKEYGAVVPAIPERDTIREVDSNYYIVKDLDRQKVWRIQTPQAFRRDIILKSIEQAMADNYYATDDATLVAKYHYPVKVIRGSELNIKITYPEDILLGESILKNNLMA